MNMKNIIIIAFASLALPARAQFHVIDEAALTQMAQDYEVAMHSLDLLKSKVDRIGDVAKVALEAAHNLRWHIDLKGAGRTLEEIQAAASGIAALEYDGNGLYQVPGSVILTADGRTTSRRPERYRKFDAVTQARNTLEDVMRDSQERRQAVRQQVQQTLAQLESASTMAEVAKLSAVLTAQSGELGVIDRERDAALSRIIAQRIENETDSARQLEARREEQAAVWRAAGQQLGEFLTPNTAPVILPDTRHETVPNP